MNHKKLYSAAMFFLTATLIASVGFTYGWGWDRINDRSLPLDAYEGVDGNGSGITIYTVGTGIDPVMHTWGGRALCEYDVTGLGCDDTFGWTSFVTSVAAGSEYSQADQAQVRGVRVLNNMGGGTFSDVINGLEYVQANAPSKAVALVDIGTGINPHLEQVVSNLVNSGVIVVVPAGNEGQNACNTSPARLNENPTSNLIVVGATIGQGSYDAIASWSNHGECVDILAPGADIAGAWPGPPQAFQIEKSMSGTSIAAAHVAGVIAIMLSNGDCHSPGSCKNYLLANATPGVFQDLPVGTPNLMLYVE